MAEAPPAPLRVLVVTSPANDAAGVSVHDVELVKAALLYAREVELVSPAAP